MRYLVDTNVLSELRKREPAARVVHWIEARPARALYLSVLSVGEMRRGIEPLPEGPRRRALEDWLSHDLPTFFAGRLLPIDTAVAERWGRVIARAGRPLPAIDSLLAATALHHELALVTRNVRDFAIEGLEVVDPWRVESGEAA